MHWLQRLKSRVSILLNPTPTQGAQLVGGVGTDGSVIPLQLDSSGNLKSTGGGGGSSSVVAIQGLTHKGSHTTVSNCSTIQAPSVPSGALVILVQCFGQDIRVTTDGTPPVTGTTGFTQSPSDGPKTYGVAGNTFKFIEDTASATAQYQFYG